MKKHNHSFVEYNNHPDYPLVRVEEFKDQPKCKVCGIRIDELFNGK